MGRTDREVCMPRVFLIAELRALPDRTAQAPRSSAATDRAACGHSAYICNVGAVAGGGQS
jgi:hypothetical protein